MQLDKLIILRRSKRKYLDKKVPFKKLAQILDMARYAPSAGNLQNWKFIVITEKKTREQISEACLKQYWMNNAPVFIIIAGDLAVAKPLYHSKAEQYTIQSCANSAILMQLKALDLGLGTAWVGSFAEKTIQRILKMPDSTKPIIILTLGYSAEPSLKKKMNPLSNIVFFDKYGNKLKEFKSDLLKTYTGKIKNLVKKKT